METLVYFPVNGVLVCARIDPGPAEAGAGEPGLAGLQCGTATEEATGRCLE